MFVTREACAGLCRNKCLVMKQCTTVTIVQHENGVDFNCGLIFTAFNESQLQATYGSPSTWYTYTKSSSGAPSAQCLEPYEMVEGAGCFNIVHSEVTHSDAEAACAADGGTLFALSNIDEYEVFVQHMTALGEDMTALGEDMTSLGEDMTSLGEDMTALGEDMTALGEDMTALGEDMTALGEDMTALG